MSKFEDQNKEPSKERILSGKIGAIGEVIAAHEFLNMMSIDHELDHLLSLFLGDPLVVRKKSKYGSMSHIIEPAHQKRCLGDFPAHLDLHILQRIEKCYTIMFAEVKSRTRTDWTDKVERHHKYFNLNGYAYESLKMIGRINWTKDPISGFYFIFIQFNQTRDEFREWFEDDLTGHQGALYNLLGLRDYDMRLFHDNEVRLYENRNNRPQLEIYAWRHGEKIVEKYDDHLYWGP